MRRQTRAGLAVAALSLLLVAARPIMRKEDWLDGLEAPLGWIVIPGVTPRNLAGNIEGLTADLEQVIEYAERRRGLGLSDPEVERRGDKTFLMDHDLLTLYAGWLADAVERMPEVKDWKDDVEFRPFEGAEDEWKRRLPVARDFKVWEKKTPKPPKAPHDELRPGGLGFQKEDAR